MCRSRLAIAANGFRPHSGFCIVVCVGVMSLCDVVDFEWIYHNQHCKFSSVMYVFPFESKRKKPFLRSCCFFLCSSNLLCISSSNNCAPDAVAR